ncbi:MAG: hypothetical protein HYX37_07255 [Rhizobiales bacterium]|nr:hypothetical protein [Hyphomicrobiales bacterium]
MYLYQPIATTFAAIVVVCVTGYFAWHQREIAKEQARIAKEKLRLDLYDRRFEIFSSIFDFYEAMISWEGTLEQKAARTRFFRAYQESDFLFTKESGIPDTLKMLLDAGAAVIGFKENSEKYKSDPKFLMEQFNKTTDIQLRVFEEGLSKLRAAMHQYLDFSKI